MLIPSVVNTVQICSKLGVHHVMLSPGSRSAPLTLAFVRHPEIATKIMSDERSAAFVGLGIAQQLRQPVGLVCTSGSAAYNYAPAVAEAFFQHVPLVVFTADRPPEWIDQLDGQTIRQRGIYGSHVKGSFELPVGQTEVDVWHAGRIVSEAINLSQQYPPGPVHINVPLREPFYPDANQPTTFDDPVKAILPVLGQTSLPEEVVRSLAEDWASYENKLIVGGQGTMNTALVAALEQTSTRQQIPLVADVISNLHPVASAVQHADVVLAQQPDDLAPDLLITFGRSVISKNLKLFLRKHRPAAHWHIQPAGPAADTFQSLTRIIHIDPLDFFRLWHSTSAPSSSQQRYYQQWQQAETKAQQQMNTLFEVPSDRATGEFQAIQTILGQLPDRVNLHLANSMTVRYANLVGLSGQQAFVEVFANRGTSGIDGSNSTAVGSALASDRLTVLLTGDLAFFYDRNAFWHQYPLPNLRIVLLNNHAGGIFRLIEGPSRQPELEEYFETYQPLTAENTARDFNMGYQRIDFTASDSLTSLTEQLPSFFSDNSKQPQLLEIITDTQVNQQWYAYYQSVVRGH